LVANRELRAKPAREIVFKNSTKEVEALVNAKPEVLQWDTSDVLAWLRTSMPGLFEIFPEFTRRA